jgi:hypothetical protein
MLKFLLLLAAFLFLSPTISAQQPRQKKNKRPQVESSPTPEVAADKPVFFYEFEKPEFTLSKIRIAHDKNGLGTVKFTKKSLEEDFEMPVRLSKVTTDRLESLWAGVGYLETRESYQSKRDYAHLGAIRLWLEKDNDIRRTEFNWTENEAAKLLADEYRKIGYEYVWMFDIGVSRRNQPLESPRIMKTLASYIERDRISDPVNMIPFLSELSRDERLPLIARNHAKRLIEKIKKENTDR